MPIALTNGACVNPKPRTPQLRLCCLSGLIGSALFLCGDMMFYGTLSSGAGFHPYIEMAQRSTWQLVIGGALGPVAALFSAFGMGVFYLTMKSGGTRRAWATTTSLGVMMLIGGAYHAVYAVLGFASKVTDPAGRELLVMQVTSLRDTISYPMYATGVAGTASAYWHGLSTKTQFPRWLLMFIPTSLSMASSLCRNWFLTIPTPVGGLVRGGWINGTFVVFFSIATVVFWRSSTESVVRSAPGSLATAS